MTTRSFLKLVVLAPLGFLLPQTIQAYHPRLQLRRLTICRNGEFFTDQPFSSARSGDTIWVHSPCSEDVANNKGFLVEEDPVPSEDPYNQGNWTISVTPL